MDFIKECYDKIEELNIDWQVRGLLDKNDRVYSLGKDTKILGRIFELIAAPIIKEVAGDNGLKVLEAESQTIYPDFTLMVDENDKEKIAVDVKSTYRRGKYKVDSSKYPYKAGERKTFTFTLGSYASYLRNNTKNIQYPYDSYSKHYVIGFLYSRNEGAKEGTIKDFSDRDEIAFPYLNVEYFIQEKYKIAGDKPGSGNTENIASFPTNDINDLREGKGPFADLGEEVFEDYWRNFPRYREEGHYNNFKQYLEWKKK